MSASHVPVVRKLERSRPEWEVTEEIRRDAEHAVALRALRDLARSTS